MSLRSLFLRMSSGWCLARTRAGASQGVVMRSPAACQPLEPRRLLSGVFISRSIDKDSGFGPNLSVGSVAVGNVNGDDKLDIVMTSDGGSSVAFLLGTGS